MVVATSITSYMFLQGAIAYLVYYQLAPPSDEAKKGRIDQELNKVCETLHESGVIMRRQTR